MKTVPTYFSRPGWILFFCLILAATTAQCQKFGGIIAQEGITESGNVEMDSFDSSTNLHSVWQPNQVFRRNYFNPAGIQYGIWSNSLSYVSNSYVTLGIPARTADIDVFSESNTVSVGGNLTVAGYLQTETNGIASLGASSTVGDLAWCFGPSGTGSGAAQGIQPEHWQSWANLQFQSFPLPIPSNSWQTTWIMLTNLPIYGTNIINIGGMWTNSAGVWSQVGGTLYTNKSGSGLNIGGNVYHFVITNRLENTNWVYYEMSNPLSMNIFVDAQHVVLYLPQGMNYTSSVFTLNTNADIQIWSGSNISTRAQSWINNMSGYAPAFSLYDIAGNSNNPINVTLNYQSMPTGYYYLPSSTLTFVDGGDFVGEIICYSFYDKGGANIHYDESLGVNLQLTAQPSILSWFYTPSKDWFTCHLVGTTGLVYSIEASTDLVNWTPVWTNTSPFVFTDTNLSLYPQRFFRPVLNP